MPRQKGETKTPILAEAIQRLFAQQKQLHETSGGDSNSEEDVPSTASHTPSPTSPLLGIDYTADRNYDEGESSEWLEHYDRSIFEDVEIDEEGLNSMAGKPNIRRHSMGAPAPDHTEERSGLFGVPDLTCLYPGGLFGKSSRIDESTGISEDCTFSPENPTRNSTDIDCDDGKVNTDIRLMFNYFGLPSPYMDNTRLRLEFRRLFPPEDFRTPSIGLQGSSCNGNYDVRLEAWTQLKGKHARYYQLHGKVPPPPMPIDSEISEFKDYLVHVMDKGPGAMSWIGWTAKRECEDPVRKAKIKTGSRLDYSNDLPHVSTSEGKSNQTENGLPQQSPAFDQFSYAEPCARPTKRRRLED